MNLLEREKLNKLVAEYQKGDSRALNQIFHSINHLIEKCSREIEHKINDVTKFDCRMLIKIKNVVSTFNIEEDDFVSIVKTLISREKSDFLKRRSKKIDEVSYESLARPDDEDDVGFQFKDKRVNIESELLHKERITLLAQGDPRRKLILSEWSKGTNDSSISEMLAHRIGGKAESHRKFIQRFRIECQNRLKTEMTA